MKAITLIQPWASLIMLQEKIIETRSWSTSFRGRIAIHAGKKIDKKVFEIPYYREVLSNYGITASNIITSAIICTCDIVDVRKSEDVRDHISAKELAFGNYENNRFCWMLENINKIDPVLNVKGMLGLWKYKPVTYTEGTRDK